MDFHNVIGDEGTVGAVGTLTGMIIKSILISFSYLLFKISQLFNSIPLQLSQKYQPPLINRVLQNSTVNGHLGFLWFLGPKISDHIRDKTFYSTSKLTQLKFVHYFLSVFTIVALKVVKTEYLRISPIKKNCTELVLFDL